MVKRMGAALLTAFVLGIVQPAAQEPVPTPTLAMVRERVRAGDVDYAWSLIQKIPESSEVLREGIAIALARTDVTGAMQWYERLVLREPSGHAAQLKAIARARAYLLRANDDPAVRVYACVALLTIGEEECEKDLRAWANDGSLDVASRLEAAAALFRANKPDSRALLEQIVQSTEQTSPSAVADALGRLPAGFATPVLIRFASSENRDARYLAALALSRETSREAQQTLRAVAADETAGAARLAAHIGLARAGDRDALKFVEDALPFLGGRELLETGRAFLARRDPRGQAIVVSVLEGDNELLRFDAAETLRTSDPRRADAVVLAGIASANPWIRARALQAAAGARMPAVAAIRREVASANPWVAVRAAQAVLAASTEARAL
jgi:HEAT repeat protein